MTENDKKEKFATYWNRTQRLLGGNNTIESYDIEKIVEMPSSGIVDAQAFGTDNYTYRMPSKHYYANSVDELDKMIELEYEDKWNSRCLRIAELEEEKKRYENLLDNIRNVICEEKGI